MPFHRFRRADGAAIDSLLGPEMKSTGEVMGIDRDFGSAFAKSQTAAYGSLPAEGTIFVSVANRDKRSLVFPVKRLADLGFRVLATEGTAEMLRRNGIPCDEVRKHFEPAQPGRPALSAVDAIRAGEVDMVINTPYGNSGPRIDGYEIRSAAVGTNIPCVTTVQGASAAIQGIEAGIRGDDRCALAAGTAQHAEQRRPLTVSGFGARLAEAVSSRGPLCLGIDPHPELLQAWDLPVSADGLAAFCDTCVAGLRRLRRRQTASRVFRGLWRRRIRGAGARPSPRCAMPACWCSPTPNEVISDRRWRPTRLPGPAIRRWPPTP